MGFSNNRGHRHRTLGAFSLPQHDVTSIRALSSSSSSSSSSRPAKYTAIYSSQRILPLERPPDPYSFSSDENTNNKDLDGERNGYVKNQAQTLHDWMKRKQSIVCVTGAGMSTESGIPDYRGNRGSYFRGHKPIIHHEFMNSEKQRQRYWARSLVGYSPFANAQPNVGHEALAKLEEKGIIGVKLEECNEFDLLGDSCFGEKENNVESRSTSTRMISIITQNVDTLHSKAGIKHCLHLHGRGDLVRCMNCGHTRDRKEYHDRLMEWNQDWLEEATSVVRALLFGNVYNRDILYIKLVDDNLPDADASILNRSHSFYDQMPLTKHCCHRKLE